MKTTPVLLAILAVIVPSSGCVTGTTIAAAKDRITYKPTWSEGVMIGSEVDTVEKGTPGYYALVPFAVAADIVLAPVYVGAVAAVNIGLMKPPY